MTLPIDGDEKFIFFEIGLDRSMSIRSKGVILQEFEGWL